MSEATSGRTVVKCACIQSGVSNVPDEPTRRARTKGSSPVGSRNNAGMRECNRRLETNGDPP